MTLATQGLPPEITVFERGWLSANNVLFLDAADATLVDTGYCTHAEQTVALVESALGGRPLARILNTHLHSDHCGGNALLQAHWPGVATAIPPGQWDAVRAWSADALSYEATGQQCPRFRADALLAPGSQVQLAGRPWQVHAAPGHDNDAVLLFEPVLRILISGDALWANGFGVVFPELGGVAGFASVAATLDLIERLAPATVIPGHGSVFTDVAGALASARRRLAGFVADPAKHARHAAKVLLKYKLLEWQRKDMDAVRAWLLATPLLVQLHRGFFAARPLTDWADELMQELAQSGAARIEGGVLHDQ